MEGKYIYGIIDSANDITLATAGLGNGDAVRVRTHRGVGCVLSNYSGRELSSISRDETLKCLLRHQAVIEHVMGEHTVIPVRFGTVLPTSMEVDRLLSQGHTQFVEALARMADKVEVEVAATWDTDRVLRDISADPEVVQAREAAASRPAGHTLEDRIRLGQIVKAAMDRRRDNYRIRMLEFLKPISDDVQPNALVSDRMVMNVAFLLEKSLQGEFDSRVGQLNDLFQDQIAFRIIGPLPPYSFASIEVVVPNPEHIEAARQLLGLGEVFSEPDIRKAYRHLAAEVHPDCKPGDELARNQFTRLRQASELLIAHSKGQAEAGGLAISIRRRGEEELQYLRFVPTGG